MNVSKRQQRRHDNLFRNKDRIERLIEKYGTSEEINKRINEIETRGISGTLSVKDMTELEVLSSQYRLLREYESFGGGKSKKEVETTEEKDKPVALKTKSVFWDAELNPLGEAPEQYTRNYKSHKGFNNAFISNIEEGDDFSYPVEEKPKFYRIRNHQTEYSNE